jgi:tRNA-specific 2-thiouridylase
MKTPRVIVGLSGGVDSSVAALLLLEKGYQVEGLFMKNWVEDDSDRYCPANQDFIDAQQVCDMLNIQLHTANFSDEYWDKVFEYFLTEYRNGRTPNPDVLCNREIKFKTFLNYCLTLGADYIATGHYAQINTDPSKVTSLPRYQLKKAVDFNKDQSYFLYTLEQKMLAKSLFPIGHLNKPTVREIAKKSNFPNCYKKDSTGICFIGERKFKDFLSQYIPTEPGLIETTEGKVVGKHDGLMFYTIGQRQGLKIGGQSHTNNTPWYVVAKDLKRNILTVVPGESHPLLYSASLNAHQLHWITNMPDCHVNFNCMAKIRYRQKEEPCTVEFTEDNNCLVTFKNPQRAVTPGQSIVFYEQDICLGGGIIH